MGVAELGAVELRAGGPCGEDGGLRVVLVDEADGLLVEDDEVAVGEVVLGREGVGRVDPDAGEECCSAEGGEADASGGMRRRQVATQSSRTSGYIGSR